MREVMKICVWDDETEFASDWVEQIDTLLHDNDVEVVAHDRKVIDGELQLLHDRRRAYLESDEIVVPDGASQLDNTDILIVDNDLFALEHFSDFSAEMVANRARVYTTCGYVVVLNSSPDLDFNLSLLGHTDSKADLHINDRFVADDGLWLTCPKGGGTFRPWHWPLLQAAARLYKERVTELRDFLASDEGDMPILDYFGFEEDAKNRLSRSARAFLHPKRRAEEVSFYDFLLGNARAVDVKDGDQVIKKRDNGKISQICVHRISKLLDRLILGPQDVLVDLPHLVEKLPFLIPPDQQDNPEFWSSMAQLKGAQTQQLVDDISPFQFERKVWFDRPVFWWGRLDTEENLDKMLAASDSNPKQLVFCEDASAFHESVECQRFVAAHHSMSDNRFVRWLSDFDGDINYGPQSRLAQ